MKAFKNIPKIGCICENPPLNYQNYIEFYSGIDYTNGRYAEVTMSKCKYCNRTWLNYLVEFEAFTKSGRWYKGIVLEHDVSKINPKNSIKYIEELDWYIFGGSYFNSTGMYGKGKAIVDLFE